MEHDECVKSALKWANNKFGVAFSELKTINNEHPDVIAFQSWGESALIECKVSRQDFHKDKKKTFRIYPEMGMGKYRFYCCPTGLIKVEELPENWGLLYVSENFKCKIKYNPYGKSNVWRGGFAYNDRNFIAEYNVMYSALRRIK